MRHQQANDAVTFHGQEKSDTNTKLARMNLAVHGLDASNIRQACTTNWQHLRDWGDDAAVPETVREPSSVRRSTCASAASANLPRKPGRSFRTS